MIIGGGKLISPKILFLLFFNSCVPYKGSIIPIIQGFNYNTSEIDILNNIKCYYGNFNDVVVAFCPSKEIVVNPDSVILDFDGEQCFAAYIDIYTGSFNLRKRIYNNHKTTKKQYILVSDDFGFHMIQLTMKTEHH